MRVLICQNYTEYITNKERLNGPTSASKIFFDKSILHNLLHRLNWKTKLSLYYVLAGGGGANDGFGEGLQRRSPGISSKSSDHPLPTPNNIEKLAKCRWKRILYGCNIARGGEDWRMEGLPQLKLNDKFSLRSIAESHATWKLGFFLKCPKSF